MKTLKMISVVKEMISFQVRGHIKAGYLYRMVFTKSLVFTARQTRKF